MLTIRTSRDIHQFKKLIEFHRLVKPFSHKYDNKSSKKIATHDSLLIFSKIYRDVITNEYKRSPEPHGTKFF